MWNDTKEFIQCFEAAEKEDFLVDFVLQNLLGNVIPNSYRAEQIDYVVNKSGNINGVFGITGETLLERACELINVESVHILIEKGADINVITNKKMTPIMTLLATKTKNMKRKKEIFVYLLQKGASLQPPKGSFYKDLYELLKKTEQFEWLETIRENQNILNVEQRKEWQTIRLKTICS